MKTKIICTIGPASLDQKILTQMAEAGMFMARLNTKYGDEAQYKGVIETLSKLGIPLMFDVKGPDKIDLVKTLDSAYLAVSFAESAEQIEKIRQEILPKNPKIIAKIESQHGIDQIDNLIKICDGIMVARGDLGRNIKLEDVPIYQKIIIKKCNEADRMVITATEMLLSMTDSELPERAEVSDVANAILDGTDFVMLSEETSIGKFPVQAVAEMQKIIEETEKKKNLLN